ncbi:MAG: outer membrane beta-barrel protein [Proteobacteria bacterium]|nr:outer membrane beta-barrel protein [Pseudomonadota bacterium]
MGRAARRILGIVVAALVLGWAGAPAHAQRLRTIPPAQSSDDPSRAEGWQGLPQVEPEAPSSAAEPRTDAEAAGLRTTRPAAPARARTLGAQRDAERAQSRRTPWTATPARPAPLAPDAGVAPPPPATAAARRPTSQPAPMANRRTGRMPRRPAEPATNQTGRLVGLRTFTATAPSARAPSQLAPGRDDGRALDRGLRGVAVPVQPRRPVDVPIVTERSQLPAGRVLPNANPLGRNTIIDPRTGEVISYDRRPQQEADPFAPAGLRVGTFIVTPTVDATLGYDSNPRRLPSGGQGSLFTQSYGEVQARSDWSRHELTARIRGTYSAYFSDPGVNRPELNAVATGRIDVARDTRLETEARYNLTATSPGSSNLPSSPDGLRNLPLIRQFGASAGVVQDIGRLQVSLRGTFDRYTHDDAVTNAGAVLPQAERDYNAYGGRLRVSYEATPGLRPFVEAGIEQRHFDRLVSSGGTLQGSTATTYRIGSTFELTRLITGEISAGYMIRDNREPTFGDIRVPVFDAALTWTPTALTTVRLTAKSIIDESFTTGASGLQRRDVAVELEHSFRRWLIGTARLAYGQDVYQGTTRVDQRMVASVNLVYRASRNMQIRGEVRREALFSNQAGQSYSANVVLLGLRLQR